MNTIETGPFRNARVSGGWVPVLDALQGRSPQSSRQIFYL
jgi:hypothetical protein